MRKWLAELYMKSPFLRKLMVALFVWAVGWIFGGTGLMWYFLIVGNHHDAVIFLLDSVFAVAIALLIIAGVAAAYNAVEVLKKEDAQNQK